MVGETYGARAGGPLLAGGGEGRLLERRFGPHGVPLGGSDVRFPWPG